VDSDCSRIFVDCDTRIRPPPFIAMRDVGQTRFGIAAVKLWAGNCENHCSEYGSGAAVVDTDEKYETVYKLTQKTNKKQGVTGNYVIGLEINRDGKLILGSNEKVLL
jgi:hypothetical protein